MPSSLWRWMGGMQSSLPLTATPWASLQTVTLLNCTSWQSWKSQSLAYFQNNPGSPLEEKQTNKPTRRERMVTWLPKSYKYLCNPIAMAADQNLLPFYQSLLCRKLYQQTLHIPANWVIVLLLLHICGQEKWQNPHHLLQVCRKQCTPRIFQVHEVQLQSRHYLWSTIIWQGQHCDKHQATSGQLRKLLCQTDTALLT